MLAPDRWVREPDIPLITSYKHIPTSRKGSMSLRSCALVRGGWVGCVPTSPSIWCNTNNFETKSTKDSFENHHCHLPKETYWFILRDVCWNKISATKTSDPKTLGWLRSSKLTFRAFVSRCPEPILQETYSNEATRKKQRNITKQNKCSAAFNGALPWACRCLEREVR